MKYLSGFFLGIVAYSFWYCQPGNQKAEKAGADSTFTLSVNIKGLDTGWVFFYHRFADSVLVDSIRLDSSHFIFKGKIDEPHFCELEIGKNGEREILLDFFLDHSEENISGHKDSISNVRITGSHAQDEYKAFMAGMKSIEEQDRILSKLYDSLKVKNDKKGMDSIQKKFGQLVLDRRDYAKAYARQNPSSIVATYEIFDQFSIQTDVNKLDSMYKGLDPNMQNSYYGRKIKKIIDIGRLTAVGSPAPLFSQNDQNGNPVSLISFRGKYVLIDFWASWCGPCRLENPNIVKTYQLYHSKGLKILSVSLDDNKAEWLEAVRKDYLDWTQVSDLQGWKNSVAKQYGVIYIPTNFLIDKDGKIVGIGLLGSALRNKLQEVILEQTNHAKAN